MEKKIFVTDELIMEKKNITKKVMLVTPNDVKRFVWVASECKGEVEVIEQDGFIKRNINAKSILGMFSLNLTEPIAVIFHDVYGDEEFFKAFKEWEVE